MRGYQTKKLQWMARLFASVLFAVLQGTVVHAARLKDIAEVEGVRGNQLYGYGIVVGLNGTGDGNQIQFTTKGLSNLLENMGIRVNPEDIRVKNVASVMVTATLPAFAKPGTRLDISLASMGDAKSLLGGTLLFTPMKGADGNVYAVAQGPVTVGGFSVESGGGDAAVQNHPTSGLIAQGAIVERGIPFDLFQSQRIRIVLREPDFTTMTRVVQRINDDFNRPLAVAVDAGAVEIPLGKDLMRDPISLMARLEQLEVQQDRVARVVVNERTGTVVMGEDVTLGRVALAHGNLNIVIRNQNQAIQPQPFSERGDTAIVSNTDITLGEDVKKLSIVGGDVTLREVIDALNALGASPRDLVSIFNALKKAGALNADLLVM